MVCTLCTEIREFLIHPFTVNFISSQISIIYICLAVNYIFIKRVMSMGTDRADPLEQYSVQSADVSNTPLNKHTPHTNRNIK